MYLEKTLPTAYQRDARFAIAVFLITLAPMFTVPAQPKSMDEHPFVDPKVRELLRAGSARVLVELRVSAQTSPSGPQPEAIAAAQRSLMARLASTRASVVRQYTSIPYLALEIDAAALAELERMGDLVVRVVADTTARTSQRAAPTRPDAK